MGDELLEIKNRVEEEEEKINLDDDAAGEAISVFAAAAAVGFFFYVLILTNFHFLEDSFGQPELKKSNPLTLKFPLYFWA